MSISFPDGPGSLTEHVSTCGRATHFEFALGVYDNFGQRVNAYRSIACGGAPYPDPNEWATAQAPLWPGFSIAVWADAGVEPPVKLTHGPAPDATASA
jgi:hypothetical protein